MVFEKRQVIPLANNGQRLSPIFNFSISIHDENSICLVLMSFI